MNALLSLILLGSTSGPASLPAPATPPGVAMALVFSPVDRASMPPLDLTRDHRQPVAVVGFDQPTVTYYHLRVDDRQSIDTDTGRNGWAGGLRRAVTVRVGFSTR